MTIDKCKNPNEITELKIKSESGQYVELEDTKVYNVVTISYLAKKLRKIHKEILETEPEDLETDVLTDYIKKKHPTESKKHMRINIINCNSSAIVFGVVASIFVVGAIGFLLFKKWKHGKNSQQPVGHNNQNFQIE